MSDNASPGYVTRVYRYGLLPPAEGSDHVREQLRLAHAYRNRLVEIERVRRSEMRTLDGEDPSIAVAIERTRTAITAEESAYSAVRSFKAETNSGTPPEALKSPLKDAQAEAKQATLELRRARREFRKTDLFISEQDRINEEALAARKAARAASDLYWGTYQLIEDANRAAAGAPLYDKDGITPNDPNFERWTGEGAVSVQLSGGMPAGEVLANADTRLRIGPPDPRFLSKRNPNSNRSRRRQIGMLYLRVGSDDARGPIWAGWPVILHRPLPEDAQIQRVTVHVRKTANRESWYATFTLRLSPPEAHRSISRVAMDLGWRVTSDGLRVATCCGDDEKTSTLALSQGEVGAIRKAEELRSIRDKHFDEVRLALANWLSGTEVPAWLREATMHLSQWRSPARLAAVVKRWSTERFAGDEVGYLLAEKWRYHDHHLWTWECNQREQALRRRHDKYRVFAAELATRYGHLAIEEFDLRHVAKKGPVEEPETNATARGNRQIAAVGELRTALVQAFAARGGTVQMIDALNSTKQCHKCSHIDAWDQAEELRHTCTQCGESWDQDENAARNLLARSFERSGDGGDTGGARKLEKGKNGDGVSESRWQRAKRMRDERHARFEGDRKSPENVL